MSQESLRERFGFIAWSMVDGKAHNPSFSVDRGKVEHFIMDKMIHPESWEIRDVVILSTQQPEPAEPMGWRSLLEDFRNSIAWWTERHPESASRADAEKLDEIYNALTLTAPTVQPSEEAVGTEAKVQDKDLLDRLVQLSGDGDRWLSVQEVMNAVRESRWWMDQGRAKALSIVSEAVATPTDGEASAETGECRQPHAHHVTDSTVARDCRDPTHHHIAEPQQPVDREPSEGLNEVAESIVAELMKATASDRKAAVYLLTRGLLDGADHRDRLTARVYELEHPGEFDFPDGVCDTCGVEAPTNEGEPGSLATVDAIENIIMDGFDTHHEWVTIARAVLGYVEDGTSNPFEDEAAELHEGDDR